MTPVLDELLQRLDNYSDRLLYRVPGDELCIAYVHVDRFGERGSSERSKFIRKFKPTFADLLAHYEEDPRIPEERYWQ